MSEPLRFVAAERIERLDRLLATCCGVGRRRAHELIEQGLVRVDGHRRRGGFRVEPGAVIEVAAPQRPVAESPLREAKESPRVVWQHGHLLAVYKPRGYHSLRGRGRPTLADFIAATFPSAADLGRDRVESGLAHRLDRDTSGVMLAAMDATAYAALRRAFSAGEVEKEYLALVHGELVDAATIDIPLTRAGTRVRPARAREVGLEALTRVTPLESASGWSLVGASMRTGVTHQIRAHLALVGHPIVGDLKYGPAAATTNDAGHFLHARRITLPDGVSVSVDPGEEFLARLASLRREARRDGV